MCYLLLCQMYIFGRVVGQAFGHLVPFLKSNGCPNYARGAVKDITKNPCLILKKAVVPDSDLYLEQNITEWHNCSMDCHLLISMMGNNVHKYQGNHKR